MVKEIQEENLVDVLHLLHKDSVTNCYILSDLEVLGLKHPSLSLYGQFNKEKLESILMLFNRYAIFYSNTDKIETAMIDLITRIKPFAISGGAYSMKQLLEYIHPAKEKTYTLAVLSKDNYINTKVKDPNIKILKSNKELQSLYLLLKDITEFNVSSQDMNQFIKEKKIINQAGNSYGLFISNQLCSSASTLSETKDFAVINGVATKNEFRNKGYANRLVNRIIYDYITIKNKSLILYYNNEIAARMYLNKGFKPYGTWISLNL